MLTLKERLDKLVDPDYGLIKYISVLPRSPDEANIFVGLAIIQDPLALPPQSEFTRLNAKDMKQGAGCGFTLEECLWSTVGESVERYAACVYDVKDLKISSFSQLSERDEAIDPRRFIRFSDEQYKKPGFVFSAPQPDDQIAWTVGVNVLTGVQTYVPASLVYMYYSALTPKDSRIDKGYSTGLAAGSNYFMAIHSGLREVLERDAYALHWFSKRTAPRIDMEQLKKNTTPNIRKLLEQANAHIELRDYTTDLGIPCVLSQIKTSCFGGVASGSSSNLNGLRCNEKALIESFHTLNWCIDMLKHHQVMELEDIVQYEHHVRYYFTDRPESRHNLDFLTADAPLSTMDLNNDQAELAVDHKAEVVEMVSKLKAKGFDVYAVDLTTDELRDAGFVVVKVLVPGLQPLYCGTGFEHLDTRRLEQFTKHFGIEMPHPVSVVPHPFP